MKLVAPCKGCLDRVAEPNCHETCEEYLLFKWLKEEQKAKEYKEKELDAFHNKLGYRRHLMGGINLRKKAEADKWNHSRRKE